MKLLQKRRNLWWECKSFSGIARWRRALEGIRSRVWKKNHIFISSTITMVKIIRLSFSGLAIKHFCSRYRRSKVIPEDQAPKGTIPPDFEMIRSIWPGSPTTSRTLTLQEMNRICPNHFQRLAECLKRVELKV